MKQTTKAFFMAFMTYLLLEEPKLCNEIFGNIMKIIDKKAGNKNAVPDKVA